MTAPNRKPAQSIGNGSLFDANLELVKQMGSKKGYDPIPPDQYLYFLTSGDEVQKVLAIIRSRTIRKGHRSPFAVEENGIPTTKADIARIGFGGDRSNARRAWDRTAALGLVFEDEKGFLCLNGAVTMPEIRRTKIESKWSAQTTLPRYLIENAKALPEARRILLESHYAAFTKYREALETDALTLARIRGDEIEDSILQHYGLERRRLEKKHRPELREEGSALLQMKLLLVPKELQEFVHTTDEVRTDHENGFAQTTHINKVFRGSEETSTAASNVNPPASERAPSEVPPDRSRVDLGHGRRRRGAPPWEDELANYLETLPIGTFLDKPMLLQITDTLSEGLFQQFKIATNPDPKKGDVTKYAATSEDGKGIRSWAGVLTIAKQVAARGVVKKTWATDPKPPREETEAEKLAAWELLAANEEETPEARAYAREQLRLRAKGAGIS